MQVANALGSNPSQTLVVEMTRLTQPRGHGSVSRGQPRLFAAAEQKLPTRYASPGTGTFAFSPGARWSTSVPRARRVSTLLKIVMPQQMTATISNGQSLARAGCHCHNLPSLPAGMGTQTPQGLVMMVYILGCAVTHHVIQCLEFCSHGKCHLLGLGCGC